MKKTIAFITIFIFFLIIYFLQSNFFNWFTIFGIKPNLFIILAVFLGLFINKEYGFITGIILGVLLDLFIGKILGIYMIPLGIAGFLGGQLSKNFSKESKITVMFIIMIITGICEIISCALQMILLNINIDVLILIRILIIEALYNGMIVIITSPLIQSGGRLLEKVFSKEDKLLKYYKG